MPPAGGFVYYRVQLLSLPLCPGSLSLPLFRHPLPDRKAK